MGKSRLVAEFVRNARRRGHRRRLRRVPVVRHEHELLRLARDLARAARDSRRPTRGRAAAALERRWRRSIRRSSRARRCSRPSSACRSRTPTLTPSVRREAAQDVARGPARRRASGRAGDESRRHRARGLPLDRRAVRATCSRSLARAAAALPVLFVLAYRPASDGRRRARDSSGIPGSRSSALERLDAARRAQLIRSKLAQLVGAATPAPRTSSSSSSPTRSEGNAFYVEELAQLHRRQVVDRPPGPGGHARHRAAREPAHASSWGGSTSCRGAAADAQGGSRSSVACSRRPSFGSGNIPLTGFGLGVGSPPNPRQAAVIPVAADPVPAGQIRHPAGAVWRAEPSRRHHGARP